MRTVSAEEMREIDRRATEEFGIPALTLMENAGIEVAKTASVTVSPEQGTVAVFCGKGNNGGDGFVAARHLVNIGYNVEVFAAGTGDDVSRDCRVNIERLKAGPVTIFDFVDIHGSSWAAGEGNYSLVIDALLGTGFSGQIRAPVSEMIDRLNGLGCPVIAVDIPSGLDASTGEASPHTVKADITVTFGLPKKGFTVPAASAYIGKVIVRNIGFPKELIDDSK